MVDYLACLECETLMEKIDSYPGGLCLDCYGAKDDDE